MSLHPFRGAYGEELQRLNDLLRNTLDLVPMRLTHSGSDSAFVAVSSLLEHDRDARAMTPAALARCATLLIDDMQEARP